MHMLTLSCVDEETNFNKLVCAMSKIVRSSVLKLAERRFRAGQTCRLMPFFQATERTALLLVFIAPVFAYWRFEALDSVGISSGFQKGMPYRKEISDIGRLRWLRKW
jgi:hypothetical protein